MNEIFKRGVPPGGTGLPTLPSGQTDEHGRETAYLEDGVYATLVQNKGMIRLTTGSHRGQEAEHVIYLQKEVFQALLDFAKRINWLKEQK